MTTENRREATTLRVTIPGKPGHQGRDKHTTKGPGGRALGFARRYADPKTESWKAVIGWNVHRAVAEARTAGSKLDLPHRGPVAVRIEAVFACPASRHLRSAIRGRVRKTSKPDFDNIEKAILDACNGVLYADDAQCFSEGCDKWVGAQNEEARTEVTFRFEPEE